MYIYLVTIVLLLSNQAYAGCPDYPEDWKRFGDSCYYLNPNLNHWDYADNACKVVSKAAHLVEINSQEELQFLIDNQLEANNDYGYHIGANRDSEGNWVWHYSEEPLTYQNWANGEPNNGENKEHCAAMMTNGKWNDVRCNEYQRSICEIPNACYVK